MKEVLIYGALVAAILGASVPVITNMANNATTAANAINTSVNLRMGQLLTIL
ncbi:MAG: hypothetical protein O3C63_01635 [Cyanobacteria bacterium]|nr:hypothetical protein [Cyanobacteriota bacterium]MDA1020012.1 hypothetical protein [Cyanobacteriota bacterium]